MHESKNFDIYLIKSDQLENARYSYIKLDNETAIQLDYHIKNDNDYGFALNFLH